MKSTDRARNLRQHAAWRRWAEGLRQGALVGAVLLALLTARVSTCWARPDQTSLRQTVPMTPPPTWTPVPSQRTATPVPARPTEPAETDEAEASSRPWLWAYCEPAVAGPGYTITLYWEIKNVGNAVDPAAHSRLVLPAAVEVQTWDPSAGSIAHLGGSMEWDLGELGHGESATCVIELRVGDDVLPGRSLELDATYSTGGEMASQMVTIQLPRALLPEAGSEP